MALKLNSKLLVLPILLAAATSQAPAVAVEKINVCHLEENNLGYVIRISSKAWPAHERHGDYIPQELGPGDACGIIE
jgi:hypothetical protein